MRPWWFVLWSFTLLLFSCLFLAVPGWVAYFISLALLLGFLALLGRYTL